ncbi:hypothetical protein E2F47_06150 [Mycobacterium eburneum]|nr:hypothetical protein [Mycobacterium eburneum]TDH56709.1 hypothetical protein E2F47_06150 [Mycobacterium eburneum]
MNRKLGLKPVDRQPRLKLADYYTSDLPTVDQLTFPIAHPDLITPAMFLNDEIGDCAIAGSIEEIRLANAMRKASVDFTDAQALQAYSEITGYIPGDPATDQGTDVHQLYEYRQHTGIADAEGQRHKVIDYAGLTPGDWNELLIALSRFEMVGIGITVPDYAEAQFEAGEPWHLIPGRHRIEGGHYVPIVGATDNTTAQLFTWGALAGITAPFYNVHNVVAVVALTEEMFTGGKTIDGIDFDKLAADLPQLNTGVVSAKAPRAKKAPRARVDVDGVDQGPGEIGTRPDGPDLGEAATA